MRLEKPRRVTTESNREEDAELHKLLEGLAFDDIVQLSKSEISRPAVRKHLRTCKACRELYDRLLDFETAAFHAKLASLSPSKRMRLEMFARVLLNDLEQQAGEENRHQEERPNVSRPIPPEEGDPA